LTAVVDNGTLIGPANDYGPSEWYMGRLLSHRGDEYKPGAALVWRVQVQQLQSNAGGRAASGSGWLLRIHE
jgi:hypothetical protein